ncbi:RNA repair domain-containing protein [Actinosynnema sp. NPDC047251]|uniref:Polynucleotide adenyltransferase n=1 Tax=Saccharothrix espanaensis (strain ATCC 51144 / DSM 44229 / JCM 9112 / NBRC 15066 / NRRL 15764) TaxID=1179773 RepID=K0JYS4_SACES|nr:RNA repair domain-containing protein [Saccharothrix espanaensis]CCH31286.1 Polynucleotide adenyltransferase [Saccharothrix espanaensis DSM 44229]
MRTSEQVYHQIRWDPRLDPARFVLGVQQRGLPPKRVPLPTFTPGGDVPWHRVLFVEADGEAVWDRETGVDRVGESAAGRVRAPRLLNPSVFTASTPHAWDPARGWVPAEPGGTELGDAELGGAVSPAAVRVLTWNVLWDRYDRELVDTARRRPLLLAGLAAADADVIALQEVEPDLMALLLAQPWVRAGYALDVDPTAPDVDRTGVVVLSRLPVLAAGRLPLSAHKAVAAVVVATEAGPLVVAATHLTSDHTANGAGKRRAQLARIGEALAGVAGDVVLVGDFNDGTRRPAAALGLRDAWLEARADEPPTFDPVVNPLAAVSSLTGRAARLDRVLVRGRLRCAVADLVGDRPVDGRYASDHFGVLATLAPPASAGVLDVEPTPRTAVVWLPGPWAEVERLRREHDPCADRWPAHVTLLFGFVPESDFERAAPLLADAVAELPPFQVRIDGVREFKRDVVWLDPAAGGAAPWTALHDAVRQRFPGCPTRDGFTPHLTVGRSRRAAEQVGARTDRVDEVVVLSRRGDGPMRPRFAVALGTGEVRWCAEEADPPGPSLDAVADRVAGVLAAALGEVHVVGSRRTGCALPDGDLDLITVASAADAVAERVRVALPAASALRPVVGARSPGWRLDVGGLGVDLTVAVAGNPAAWSSLGDAEAVLAAVGDRVDRFRRLAREVKGWARARGLDSAPFGGVPGVGWAVLAARTVLDAGDGFDGGGLAEFFGTWAAWDWRDPIGLGAVPERTGAPVTIMTPAAPVRSCTEQVGPGFRDLLTAELYRAWEVVEAGGTDLATPPDLHRVHAAWAVVTVPHDRVGPVRGRLRALLTALETAGVADADAWPRPFERDRDAVRFAIGLGRRPPDVAELGRLVAGWRAGLTGVEVVRVANGDVPTLR